MSTETTIWVEREVNGELHELEIVVRGNVILPRDGSYNCGSDRIPEPGAVDNITATYKREPFVLTDSEMESADEALQEQAGEDADSWDDDDYAYETDRFDRFEDDYEGDRYDRDPSDMELFDL